MKMLTLTALFLLLTACAAPDRTAAPDSSEMDPNRVIFADGKVSFIPPKGFNRMTEEHVIRKFPNANRPQHVFANERQSVSVGITFSLANVPEGNLTGLKDSLEKTLSRVVPGIQWQKQDLIELNGIQWVNLRFQSNAIDTEIINDMYATSFQGKGLFISYNSTVREYESIKGSFDESRSSIFVKQ